MVDYEFERKQANDHLSDYNVLAQRLPNEARPEDEGGLARQTGAAIGGVLEAKEAPLERMQVFEPDRCRKTHQQLDEACEGRTGCRRAAQQRLHMLRRVVDGPCLPVDRFPLLSAHARMRRADV